MVECETGQITPAMETAIRREVMRCELTEWLAREAAFEPRTAAEAEKAAAEVETKVAAVRQAIRLGFNRDDIMQAAFYGTGMISNTMLPEGNPYRAEVDGWAYDADKAKQLLSDAGFADGFSVTMRIVPAVPWEVPAAQIIQAYLSELKINVEIEQIESTTWFSEVFTNSDFEMSMTAHSSKVDPDLSMCMVTEKPSAHPASDRSCLALSGS